jgi:hypothetical protein
MPTLDAKELAFVRRRDPNSAFGCRHIPYEHYLKRLLRSEKLARMAVPFADAFFRVVRIKNKMIAVARKR